MGGGNDLDKAGKTPSVISSYKKNKIIIVPNTDKK